VVGSPPRFTEFTARYLEPIPGILPAVILNPLEPQKESPSRTGTGRGAKKQASEPCAAETIASEEQWVTLCARAAVEQDPKKLLDLVREINRLLEVRNMRLANQEHNKP
jgi:hypothetical protein